MKKTLALIFVTMMLITPVNTYAGEAVFKIGCGQYNINGAARDDVAPYIKNSRTYLPLRYCCYALGIGDNSIKWDSESKTAYLSKNGEILAIKAGSKNIQLGDKNIIADAPPEITGGRMMLPLRSVAEAFGCDVQWDDINKKAIVITRD